MAASKRSAPKTIGTMTNRDRYKLAAWFARHQARLKDECSQPSEVLAEYNKGNARPITLKQLMAVVSEQAGASIEYNWPRPVSRLAIVEASIRQLSRDATQASKDFRRLSEAVQQQQFAVERLDKIEGKITELARIMLRVLSSDNFARAVTDHGLQLQESNTLKRLAQ